ncbi:MAG: sensor histidine kinase, partial [Ktedonobacterales bacterium]
LEREPLAMDDMISDALEMMASVAAQTRIELVGRVDGGLPLVALDARQMYRVLTNLLQNALRYSPREGGILIQATSARGADGKLEALVRVIDAGEGIRADDLPHIFERTYRGEPSRTRDGDAGPMEAAGAGLGLAIAKGIVEAHGGRMWAQSPLPYETRALLADALPDRDHSQPGASVSFALPVVRAVRG